jgi:hypothetical protein
MKNDFSSGESGLSTGVGDPKLATSGRRTVLTPLTMTVTQMTWMKVTSGSPGAIRRTQGRVCSKGVRMIRAALRGFQERRWGVTIELRADGRRRRGE